MSSPLTCQERGRLGGLSSATTRANLAQARARRVAQRTLDAIPDRRIAGQLSAWLRDGQLDGWVLTIYRLGHQTGGSAKRMRTAAQKRKAATT